MQLKKKNFKTPRIVLHRIKDTNKLKSVIDEKLLTDDYVFAFGRNNTIRIKFKTIEKYKIITDVLEAGNVASYTFTPKSVVPFCIIIKVIRPLTDIPEIEKQIIDAGHEIHGSIVAARYQGKINLLLSIHFVSSKEAKNNERIYDIHYLCNYLVKIEPSRKMNKIAQCQKCQAFGHTRTNCFKKPARVKYGGSHLTSDC